MLSSSATVAVLSELDGPLHEQMHGQDHCHSGHVSC